MNLRLSATECTITTHLDPAMSGLEDYLHLKISNAKGLSPFGGWS